MELQTLFDRVPWHFFRSAAFLWGLAIAGACFVFGTVLVPLVWLRMPHDFFTRPTPRPPGWARAVRLALGVPLVLVGVALLVLPGQGFLTIALGLAVVDFDGKRRTLERLLVGLRLLELVNKLRVRFGRPPLELPGAGASPPPRG